jgi:hypothetical protein
MINLELVNEKIGYVRDELIELIKKNGSEMYKGVFDTLSELENDKEWWENRFNEIIEDEGDEDDEGYQLMILTDDVDRELIRRYGRKFYDNLIKLGYNYDDELEGWNIKDSNGTELTSYGVIWEYWYDLDTDVREAVSDIWEECFED